MLWYVNVCYVFTWKCMRFCILDILNETSIMITDKIKNHSQKGFTAYINSFSLLNTTQYVQHQIVT